MPLELRDYQTAAVVKVGEWLDSSSPALGMVAPTGTGKTVMQAEVLRRYKGGLQTAPSEEILDGFRRHGAPEESLWTIKKLKNRLAEGVIDPSTFRYWQIDEFHHSTSDEYREVDAFLASIRRIGWSATPFRGTPKGTAALHDWYAGNFYTVLSLRDAVTKRVMQIPKFTVHPLVDDDTVSVTNGEFEAAKITRATKEKLLDAVELIRPHWSSMPTMVALTTRDLVERFTKLANDRGIPAVPVTGDTSRADRDRAFSDVVQGKILLVQINVVSEGVDLPGLRRLVDLRPTMSPLFWMQLVGRVTRPGDITPEVWVCNHNLLRHGYLFEGLIPRGDFTNATKVWGDGWKPSRRMVSRATGIDGLGRFSPVQVPTAGSFVWFFCLGNRTTQYAAILRPDSATPVLCGRREFRMTEGARDYSVKAKWEKIPKLPDMTGCTSVPCNQLTEKQTKWWKQMAKYKGLDDQISVDSKVFQVLPFLCDLKGRLG